MRALADHDVRFSPENCPIVSCDLTECELGEIGFGVADGHLSAASYFDSVDTAENHAFKARVAAHLGPDRRLSSFFATSYATVRLCAEAVIRSGSDDPRAVRDALRATSIASALGSLAIDPGTNHADLPFHLGRIAGRGFEIFRSLPSLAADPYLVARRQPWRSSFGAKPKLRVVR